MEFKVASEINLFFLLSKCESITDFTLFIRSKRYCGSALGNAIYLQSSNYHSIKDLYSFQNYVQIYGH